MAVNSLTGLKTAATNPALLGPPAPADNSAPGFQGGPTSAGTGSIAGGRLDGAPPPPAFLGGATTPGMAAPPTEHLPPPPMWSSPTLPWMQQSGGSAILPPAFEGGPTPSPIGGQPPAFQGGPTPSMHANPHRRHPAVMGLRGAV